MDQDPRQGSPAVATQDRGPEQIRREIELVREELGDTVEALAAKADVKARAREKVTEVRTRVNERTPHSAGEAAGIARSNPAPLAAAAGLVGGAVAWWLYRRD